MKKSYYIQPMVYLVETSNFCSIHDPSGASDPSVGANQALFFDEEEEKAIRKYRKFICILSSKVTWQDS